MQTRGLAMIPRLLIAFLSLAAAAWVRPELPTTSKPVGDPANRLDYVIAEINGGSRIVREGEELQLVRGDKLLIRDASLVDKRGLIGDVNLVGYQNPRGGSDDRGIEILTDRQLVTHYSEAKKGEVYAVVASTRGQLHGHIYLKLIDPLLRFAELTVNGKTRVMRDGEPLTVKATDLLKVSRVSTNLDKDDGVLFQIIPASPKQKDGSHHYEIRFLRGELLFARIPLKVEG